MNVDSTEAPIAFDLAFLGLVLHETDDALAALMEARRVSRFRVGILEWAYRDEPDGPPIAHRMKEETVAALARESGFRSLETIPLLRMVLYRLDAGEL
jgi:ubiquinone/menaquinone biosynthesis C-methylase UbiE